MKNNNVALVACNDYAPQTVDAAFGRALALSGGIEDIIKPGMRVCEMGIAPKGFLEARNNPQADGKPAKIRKFRPNSNAQFFHFFLYMWNGDPDTDVYLAVQEPSAEEKIEDVNGKKAVEARRSIRRSFTVRRRP